jgi:hypothetical protein
MQRIKKSLRVLGLRHFSALQLSNSGEDVFGIKLKRRYSPKILWASS